MHEIFRDDLSSSKDQSIRFLGAIRSKVKVQVMKRSKMYFYDNTLSFCPIHMKPTPKCSLFNSLSSDIVTYVALVKVCALPSGLYVCMLPTFLKNYWAELHEIFRDDLSSSKDQSIRFWERLGQRSCKGQNYWTELHEIFRDDLSSSKDQSIRFWERLGQSHEKVKTTGPNCMKFSGMICYHPRTN